jgi:hypothetical protein
MFESIEDLISVFMGLMVLWLILGLPSTGADDGSGHRLGPGGSADGRHDRRHGRP